MKIKFNDTILKVENVYDQGCLPEIELEDGTKWHIAECCEEAGRKAVEYWEDMAKNDPEEFACIVGEKNLRAWCLGQIAGPKSVGVNSLEEWIDLFFDNPEELWAYYDGMEIEAQVLSRDLYEELGFGYDLYDGCPVVIYRMN